jgi:hypothetical protein
MWLAQLVCGPQFFKTPNGLCGHTVYPSGTGWSSPKSRYDRCPVNKHVLVPSSPGITGVPSERISIQHQEEYIKAKFFMLPLGGLHVKHVVQCGIWVPTEHLLWDQGKPQKTLIELAGHRTFRMQTDLQPAVGHEIREP